MIVPSREPGQPRAWAVLWRITRVVVALGLIAILVLRTDLGQLLGTLGQVRLPFLGLAAMTLFVVFLLGTIRWQALLRSRGYRFGTGFLLRVYIASLALNAVLPTSLGGDVLRMVHTSRPPRPAEGVSIVAVDRAIALLGLLIASLTASFVLVGTTGSSGFLVLSIAGLAGLGLLFLALFFDPLYRAVEWAVTRIRFFRLGEKVVGVMDGIRAFRGNPGVLCWALGLSVLLRGAYSLVWFLFGLAVGATTSFPHYLSTVQVVSIVAMLPVSIGGVGVRENGFAVLMSRVGMPQAGATTIALLFLALSYAYAVAGGLVLLGLRTRVAGQAG